LASSPFLQLPDSMLVPSLVHAPFTIFAALIFRVLESSLTFLGSLSGLRYALRLRTPFFRCPSGPSQKSQGHPHQTHARPRSLPQLVATPSRPSIPFKTRAKCGHRISFQTSQPPPSVLVSLWQSLAPGRLFDGDVGSSSYPCSIGLLLSATRSSHTSSVCLLVVSLT
jgi:hypothetical protein